ncbi:MAG TPA: hypothetical protein VFB06_34380 [Streptosporangiaceae bacterium]|nr:hypothetical protein [Streptosporangiaceae bacterium]
MQPDDDQLVGGTVLRRPAIRSPNFVSGVSGWSINIDGSAEFANATIRGSLIIGGQAPAAREVIGGTPPAELVTYYTAGAPETSHAPETIISVTITYDGNGNYAYDGYVFDSTTPVPLLSHVVGTFVNSTVNEYYRVVLNPNISPAGAVQTDFYNNQVFFETNDVNLDVFVAGLVTDSHGRFFLDAGGRIYLGAGGSALDDLRISRTGTVTLNIDADPGGASPSSTAVLDVSGNQVVPSNNQAAQVTPSGSITINTTGFSDVTGVSVSITKIYAGTRLRVRLFGAGFSSAVDNVTLGVRVNGVDNTVTVYRFNTINDHRFFGGIINISGLAAGAYTAQARLKVATGTTTFTTGSSVDGWSIEVEEVV